MNELPSFSLGDIADVAEDPEGFVRLERKPGDSMDRRNRVHCVRWSRLGKGAAAVVVLKEVHLWEEDTVSNDVHTVAARIGQLQSGTRGTAAASLFVQYLALHVDTLYHYQWLLGRCGPPLKTLIDKSATQPCFEKRRCKHMLHCVLAGLDHLHRVCGFVHGDVSLGNLLTHLSFDESNDVVLGDLETLTPLGAEPSGSPGTLLYTSPERLRSSSLPCSAHDDVWAFGIVMFQLLAGRSTAHPWCGDGVSGDVPDNFWALLDAMAEVRPASALQYLQKTPLAKSSPDAVAVVAACLSWEPCDRPAASALLRDPWFSD